MWPTGLLLHPRRGGRRLADAGGAKEAGSRSTFCPSGPFPFPSPTEESWPVTLVRDAVNGGSGRRHPSSSPVVHSSAPRACTGMPACLMTSSSLGPAITSPPSPPSVPLPPPPGVTHCALAQIPDPLSAHALHPPLQARF